MGRSGVPDRWLDYSPMGSVVPETRFVACKVPLKEALLRRLPENERFGPNDLMKAFPKLGLLVDLTNTTRYYSKEEFTRRRIKYEKIFCPGHVTPPNSIVKRFFEVVDQFLEKSKGCETSIVVHCTHGVNRTGYFICRYMIEKMNILPEKAVERFQQARGHKIERQNYVNDLKNGCKGGFEADLNPRFSLDRQIKQGTEKKRMSEREVIKNNNSKKRFIGSPQSDCLNFYNWRARNCASGQYYDNMNSMPSEYNWRSTNGASDQYYDDMNVMPSEYNWRSTYGASDQYCHDLNRIPSEYKKMKDLSERMNKYSHSTLENQDDLESVHPHRLRHLNVQYMCEKLKSPSYPNEDSKPQLCQQKEKELSEIHDSQSVRTDPKLIDSEQDKVKKSEYYSEFHAQSNHHIPNFQISRDVAEERISIPNGKASHSPSHHRNRNIRIQGIRQRDDLPSGGQNSQLKGPIQNPSVLDAPKVHQRAYRGQRPHHPQPYYLPPSTYQYYPRPSLNTLGLWFSNSFVQQPPPHFPNRAWQQLKIPCIDLTQQP